jgi:hypothetical protein
MKMQEDIPLGLLASAYMNSIFGPFVFVPFINFSIVMEEQYLKFFRKLQSPIEDVSPRYYKFTCYIHCCNVALPHVPSSLIHTKNYKVKRET